MKVEMKKLLPFLVFSIYFIVSTAQELTVRAPGRVDVGRRFEVRYEVNGQASDFRGPSFKGLSVLSGPNASRQQGMSIINGQVSHTSSTGFTYPDVTKIVKPRTIPATSVMYPTKFKIFPKISVNRAGIIVSMIP